jgi:hypothetical protein
VSVRSALPGGSMITGPGSTATKPTPLRVMWATTCPPALKLTGATLGRLQSAPRERISVCACRCSLRRSFAI